MPHNFIVQKLAQRKLNSNLQVIIEDNIGESILVEKMCALNCICSNEIEVIRVEIWFDRHIFITP